jgi:hypothetical protein
MAGLTFRANAGAKDRAGAGGCTGAGFPNLSSACKPPARETRYLPMNLAQKRVRSIASVHHSNLTSAEVVIKQKRLRLEIALMCSSSESAQQQSSITIIS